MAKDRPVSEGLYRNEFEHDSCGIGFVANIKGKKSHSIISKGLETLSNMSHRGAEGADSKTGDGAGIMIQVPRDFFLMQGYSLPPAGQFGTGIIFLPQDKDEAAICEKTLLDIIKEEGIDNVIARHARLANATREAAKALGLKLYSTSPSNAVTPVNVPAGIDGEALVKMMRTKYGVTIAGGQADLKGKVFRIAHLGYMVEFDTITAIAALEIGLKEMGYKFNVGSGVAAALKALAG